MMIILLRNNSSSKYFALNFEKQVLTKFMRNSLDHLSLSVTIETRMQNFLYNIIRIFKTPICFLSLEFKSRYLCIVIIKHTFTWQILS